MSRTQHMQSTVMINMPDDIDFDTRATSSRLDDSKWSSPTTVRELRTVDGSSVMRDTDFATDTKFMTCKLLPMDQVRSRDIKDEEVNNFYSARDSDLFLSQQKSFR